MSFMKSAIYLFCVLALLCCSAHAVTVTLLVVDDDDGSAIYGAYVYVDGDYEGKTNSNGLFTYSQDFSSKYTLEVRKSGYEDWDDWIDEDDTSVTAYLTPEKLTLNVVVYDADTVTPINNAKVTVTSEDDDDSDYDRTDSDGMASFDVDESTDYTVKIVADDYETITREIEMDDDDQTLQVWMYPSDRFAFKITDADDGTPIEGATVTVDGVEMGVTGSDGIVAVSLASGNSYSVRVTHPSYDTYSRTLSIGDESIVSEISLSKTIGSVIISVVDENAQAVPGAAVTFDGVSKGVTDSYGRLILSQVIAGSHTVAVSADGYASWEGTCTSDAQGADLQVELETRPVAVSVLAANAEHAALEGVVVGVNGASQGVTAADGSFSLELVPGTYNISGSRDGYRTAYTNQTVAVGSSGEVVTLTLESEGLPLAVIGIVAAALVAALLVGLAYTRRKRSSGRRRRPGQRSF